LNDTHDLALPAWATHVNSAKKERVQLQAKKALRRAKRDAVRQIGPHPLEPEVWTHDMIPGEWSCTLGACKSLYGDGRGTIIGSFQRGLNHLQTVHGFCGEDLDRFRQEWESLSHAIHEAETSKIEKRQRADTLVNVLLVVLSLVCRLSTGHWERKMRLRGTMQRMIASRGRTRRKNYSKWTISYSRFGACQHSFANDHSCWLITARDHLREKDWIFLLGKKILSRYPVLLFGILNQRTLAISPLLLEELAQNDQRACTAGSHNTPSLAPKPNSRLIKNHTDLLTASQDTPKSYAADVLYLV
jgi:hypothetical protein